MKRRRSREQPPKPLPQLPVSGAVIGYARVSTTDQNLAMQLADLRAYPCDRIFSETVSAVAKKRPELDEAIRTLRPGDVLVVWKLDRFARSMADLLDRWRQIEKIGAKLVSIKDRIDTTSAIGTLMFHMLGALAEFERSLIQERIAAGMKAARERGVQLGALPMFDSATRKAMRADRAAGLSVHKIAAKYGCSPSTAANYTRGAGRKPKG